MECRELKSRLMAGEMSTSTDLALHLAGCRECARFERRWELVRLGVGRPAEEHIGDGSFTARVVASLPRTPEVLGWVALRALPAALLLALVLAGLGAAEVPPPVSLLFDEPSPSQLLAWSVQGNLGDSR
jgi:hypothetical protein